MREFRDLLLLRNYSQRCLQYNTPHVRKLVQGVTTAIIQNNTDTILLSITLKEITYLICRFVLSTTCLIAQPVGNGPALSSVPQVVGHSTALVTTTGRAQMLLLWRSVITVYQPVRPSHLLLNNSVFFLTLIHARQA